LISDIDSVHTPKSDSQSGERAQFVSVKLMAGSALLKPEYSMVELR